IDVKLDARQEFNPTVTFVDTASTGTKDVPPSPSPAPSPTPLPSPTPAPTAVQQDPQPGDPIIVPGDPVDTEPVPLDYNYGFEIVQEDAEKGDELGGIIYAIQAPVVNTTPVDPAPQK